MKPPSITTAVELAMTRVVMPSADGNPFPGLRPFRPGEEHLFFGRERQIDTMIEKLARTRFLAVVGTSGSGKSSLVNCGLIPGLFRGLMTAAGPAWRVVLFRPGGAPLCCMAHAIADHKELYPAYRGELPLADVLETHLRLSSRGLVDVIRKVRMPARSNLLVVVDQFEELFRFRTVRSVSTGEPTAAEDATAFVNLLLEAPAQSDVSIFVVLTMRSDFLGDCSVFHGLPEAMNDSQYLVPRLTRDERRAAIAGPVAVSGAEIDPVLLTRLVNDVGDNPDQLSILQHALNRTWARWRYHRETERPINLSDYEAIGTMSEALDRHAEKAYGELPEGRPRVLCERMFKVLTDVGTDARGVRRPARFDALSSVVGAQPDELAGFIDVFRKSSRSFLMPPISEALTPSTVVDISHESLMRVWKRLRTWADEEAQSARIYRRLADTAALHSERRASLWVDPELQLALDWREQREPTPAWADLYGGRFDPAMAFLDQSRDVRDRTRTDAAFDQRWRSTWRGAIVLIAMVVLVFFVRSFQDSLSGPLENRLSQFLLGSVVPSGTLESAAHSAIGGLAALIVFTPISMPAILTYLLLDHLGRRAYRRFAFDRIAREIAAEGKGRTDKTQQTVDGRAEPDVMWKTSYASPPARLHAALIDGAVGVFIFLVSIFVVAIIEVVAETIVNGKASDELSSTGGAAAVGVWLILTWLYQAIPVSGAAQATLGMRMAGVFVVSRAGGRVSFARATLRQLTKPLSYGLGIGILLQPLTARRQALHDILSRTVVLARPHDEHATAAAADTHSVPAPTRRRIVAYAVDWCIGIALYFASVVAALVALRGTGADAQSLTAFGIFLVLWLAYHVFALTSTTQASLGMMAAGIYAADASGRRLSRLQALGRTLAKIPAYFTVVGVLIQPFTQKKQALHDLMSRTVVLSGKPPAVATAAAPPVSALQASA